MKHQMQNNTTRLKIQITQLHTKYYTRAERARIRTRICVNLTTNITNKI